ncbi:MAG: molybdopterin converting factor subunit 1 [Alphaproteobacteria bacterium]|nr:molybdopterin converting factor subunit 1 [Alphaproteobacteria bacterium]
MRAVGIRILYFAWLREKIGVGEESLDLPPGIDTVATLTGWLKTLSPRHEAALSASSTVRCAVNQDFAGPEAPVRPGDEVAFFPPVTGG